MLSRLPILSAKTTTENNSSKLKKWNHPNTLSFYQYNKVTKKSDKNLLKSLKSWKKYDCENRSPNFLLNFRLNFCLVFDLLFIGNIKSTEICYQHVLKKWNQIIKINTSDSIWTMLKILGKE